MVDSSVGHDIYGSMSRCLCHSCLRRLGRPSSRDVRSLMFGRACVLFFAPALKGVRAANDSIGQAIDVPDRMIEGCIDGSPHDWVVKVYLWSQSPPEVCGVVYSRT